MTRKVYAEATYRAMTSGLAPEQALSGLRTVLTRHGHMSLYQMVLKDVLVALKKAEDDTTAIIVLARADDEKNYVTQIEQFVAETKATATKVVIDGTIIGGFIAKTKSIKRDQSYKESLTSIYRSVVSE